MDLSVREALQARMDLEEEITARLQAFEKATGLHVDAVKLYRMGGSKRLNQPETIIATDLKTRLL